MLIPVIAQYLRSHRRLIIPQMGAFIVKEPGQSVLFSELLKRDDGVLRSLLVAAGSSELEAGGEIDRFVFEVRHAIQQGREFPLAGLGVLNPGPTRPSRSPMFRSPPNRRRQLRTRRPQLRQTQQLHRTHPPPKPPYRPSPQLTFGPEKSQRPRSKPSTTATDPRANRNRHLRPVRHRNPHFRHRNPRKPNRQRPRRLSPNAAFRAVPTSHRPRNNRPTRNSNRCRCPNARSATTRWSTPTTAGCRGARPSNRRSA